MSDSSEASTYKLVRDEDEVEETMGEEDEVIRKPAKRGLTLIALSGRCRTRVACSTKNQLGP